MERSVDISVNGIKISSKEFDEIKRIAALELISQPGWRMAEVLAEQILAHLCTKYTLTIKEKV